MPGAFCALLFSDWTMYPVFSYFSLHSFFIHFFMFSFPVLLIASGEIRPRFTDLWRAVIFLIVVIPPIYFTNRTLGTNFFFLNLAAPGSPLEPLQVLGMPGYLFGFMGLVVVFWVVLYLPWMIKTLLEKRIAAKEREEENEKLAIRLFLVRLGFVGPELKVARAILLRNLTGNSAWKSGTPPTRATAAPVSVATQMIPYIGGIQDEKQ